MSRVQLALYKGWPTNMGHTLTHVAICLRSLSKYSHVELVIDGMCYSSSSRDDGVRAKFIDLASGRWDVVDLPGADASAALAVFKLHEGKAYDWRGVASFVIPFLEQNETHFYCSELVALMLGLPDLEVFPGELLALTEPFRQTA